MVDSLILSKKEVVKVASGFSKLEIDASERKQVSITFPANEEATLMITLTQGQSELDFEILVEDHAQATLLFWNNNQEVLHIKETIQVGSNAHFNVAYSELGEGEVVRDAIYNLAKESITKIRSATISATKKHFTLMCQHDEPSSEALMEHYGIVLQKGDYKMIATGKIVSGASGAKSHQTTRVLTFDENQKAQVLPQLFIDEFDVEASHATSLGQMDENQLYYMQSRGLNRNEAMQLITIGYLLPIVDVINDESLRSFLKEQIETRINTTCLM